MNENAHAENEAAANGPGTDDRLAMPPVDRAAAFAAGPQGIPTKFLYWVLAAAFVLGLGGFLGERLFSSAGLNPTPITAAHGASATAPPPAAVPTPSIPNQSVSAPLDAFMGLSVLHSSTAPPFSLVDQNGQTFSVPAHPPSVVVLTFFNSSCNDICPVVAAEIKQADADLGTEAGDVEFVTVNTDPLVLALSGEAPVLSGAGLGALPNWRMVTGPLATLDSVWKAYGISISVDQKTGLEAHTDVMDFIDPHGDLIYRATPFANETTNGATYSLPASSVRRFAQGIATYAARLVTP